MSQPYRLTVVIPTHNERERLPATLRAIAAAAADLPQIELRRVVIADNGSSDDTAGLARELAAQLNLPLVIESLPAGGKASALRVAMPRAAEADDETDGVLFMDADNATDLSQIAKFDLADRSSLQFGSRFASGANIYTVEGGRSYPRRFMSWGMRTLTRRLLRLPVRDTQCGFKLFPRALVLPLFGALHDRSWVFDVELLARRQRAGIALHEVGVEWYEMPGSKVRPVQDSIGSLRALWSIKQRLAREARARRFPLYQVPESKP